MTTCKIQFNNQELKCNPTPEQPVKVYVYERGVLVAEYDSFLTKNDKFQTIKKEERGK